MHSNESSLEASDTTTKKKQPKRQPKEKPKEQPTAMSYILARLDREVLEAAQPVISDIMALADGEDNPPATYAIISDKLLNANNGLLVAAKNLARQISNLARAYRTDHKKKPPRDSNNLPHLMRCDSALWSALQQLHARANQSLQFTTCNSDGTLQFIVSSTGIITQDLRLRILQIYKNGGVQESLYQNVRQDTIDNLLQSPHITLEDIALINALFDNALTTANHQMSQPDDKPVIMLIKYLHLACNYLFAQKDRPFAQANPPFDRQPLSTLPQPATQPATQPAPPQLKPSLDLPPPPADGIRMITGVRVNETIQQCPNL